MLYHNIDILGEAQYVRVIKTPLNMGYKNEQNIILCYRCHAVRAAGMCFVVTKLLTGPTTQKELDGVRVSQTRRLIAYP
jgi:hypothetical protein